MKDINFIPKIMMKRSLSNTEVVLNYKDTLIALDLYLKGGWAFLGWEGWGKYPDGVGHCYYQGTVDINRKKNESWNHYAKRGYKFMKETIINDYKNWQKSSHVKEYELYFCITPVTEERLKELSEENK